MPYTSKRKNSAADGRCNSPSDDPNVAALARHHRCGWKERLAQTSVRVQYHLGEPGLALEVQRGDPSLGGCAPERHATEAMLHYHMAARARLWRRSAPSHCVTGLGLLFAGPGALPAGHGLILGALMPTHCLDAPPHGGLSVMGRDGNGFREAKCNRNCDNVMSKGL